MKTYGAAEVLRADARRLPLRDSSVDLVITSPPYFALRSYTDAGEHYDGQIGAEPTAVEFLDSLLEVTTECVRVLKSSGSLWVNLGDKYVADNRGSGSDTKRKEAKWAPPGDRGFVGREVARQKSLMGLPWRYAIRCIDELGLVLRAEVIWAKPNGLPESVTDRVRRSHEQWFHFTLQPRYFSAVDEIREPHTMRPQRRPAGRPDDETPRPGQPRQSWSTAQRGEPGVDGNPLGKLPGSVWTIPTEPLRVPAHLGIDHFAAFPTEWPKRLIQGWSPAGVCVACGEGRRPVAAVTSVGAPVGRAHRHIPGYSDPAGIGARDVRREITGYACACTDTSAPTTPGVVLDPFGGTGTTAMVAKALGRHGITVDMSADYCRLAEWRTNDPNQLDAVLARSRGLPRPSRRAVDEGDLFAGVGDA